MASYPPERISRQKFPPAMRFITAPLWLRLQIRLHIIFIAATAVMFVSSGSVADEPERDKAFDFFENRIRPVLVEHCYACHSEKSAEQGDLQAELFVDHADGLRQGGSSGPAVIPGDPDASLLLSAIRYEDYEMPPQGKLDDQVIEDFEQWIRAGAKDPRDSAVGKLKKPALDIDAARNHWAYRPLAVSSIPRISNVDGIEPQSAIDAYILHRARASGLQPVPTADRATLIRRLYFDLLGLPPSSDQIADFVQDHRPDAIERLVDNLIASPRFGERWARHWLDIVRYAESVTLRGLVQHEAWRYRDYTVSAFNRDLPYDDFLRQQIAGDLMPAENVEQACQQHIATTFLTLGNNNLEDQDKEKLRMDAVDEQLSVIGSALLAQTIGCARCHDHKFDPIPTSDYYSMAGILRNSKTLLDANVSNWIEQPLPATAESEAAVEEFKSSVKQLTARIAAIEKQLGVGKNTSAKSVDASTLKGIVVDNDQAKLTGNWELSNHSPRFIGSGYLHDGGSEQGKKQAAFHFKLAENGRYEIRVSYSPGANRSTKVSVSVQDYVDIHHKTINQRKPPAIDGLYESLGEFQFDSSMPGTVIISNAGADGHVIVDSVQVLPVSQSALVGQPELSDTEAVAETILQREPLEQKLSQLRSQLKELNASAPAQPKYMAIIEDPERGDIPIHIRGNVHQHGKVVPRGFLRVAGASTDLAITDGESGRRELAEWLADSTNPLPARVFANRVWHWLFGAGLCRTPDNFGTTGNLPTHPELLDYLARRLIDSGWSMKMLVREIVLSEAYQRASHATNELLDQDPDNLWLLRQNRKRIEAECMVDSILITAGRLDLKLGGKTIPEKLSADYGYEVEMTRRALYWPAFRNSISDLIKGFDGADPSLVTGKRNHSTVAPQALLMLNNPWVIAQSQAAGKRLSEMKDADVVARVSWAFETTLGRSPSAEEQQAAVAFVNTFSSREDGQAWARLVQSLWATIDFRYLY